MQPSEQVREIYHRRVGDLVITTLLDGYADAATDIFVGIDPEAATALLEAGGQPSPPRLSVNTFLVRGNGYTALIDTGSADMMGETCGKLGARLADAGLAYGDIDAVLLTHMHPDHSAGLLDEGKAAAFGNAEVILAEAEHRHWHDDAAMATADERRRLRYFEASRAQIAPYRGRLRWAEGEVLPGITAVPLPGHTPGHCGYLIASGGESVFVWGDTVHVPGIQIPRPDVGVLFDWDHDDAVASRKRALDMVATDNIPVAGMHVHFPGFARILREGAGYRLVQEAWAHTV
ncbi:MBL fold metallo-hydrolase [Acuticoccus sp. M5D2P5]|uniref:MBL fold metallo-hydrolase n=1 Tax=Acuticoccus kalidii TaxID=2910977 RepID=UPI001F45B44F|nr:MBL fold metallo-hydrolase [Acuticoccus kalidii]MCF3935066.1 MBL fold metallo-hydrolase [Acuticoccus kalidii]